MSRSSNTTPEPNGVSKSPKKKKAPPPHRTITVEPDEQDAKRKKNNKTVDFQDITKKDLKEDSTELKIVKSKTTRIASPFLQVENIK